MKTEKLSETCIRRVRFPSPRPSSTPRILGIKYIPFGGGRREWKEASLEKLNHLRKKSPVNTLWIPQYNSWLPAPITLNEALQVTIPAWYRAPRYEIGTNGPGNKKRN